MAKNAKRTKATKRTTKARGKGKATGRDAVDWVAAGKKAWATRVRNAKAAGKGKAKGAKRSRKPAAPVAAATPAAPATV
jgi:hypothetical protein